MASGLAKLPQTDFSAGGFPDVARELVPSNGFTDGINCLISDDGLPVRRGGSAYKSNANFSGNGRFIWEGYLPVGQRTFMASSNRWGCLDADDVTPVDLGAGGLANPAKGAQAGSFLFLPGGAMWGGSRRIAGYSTGNADATNGSDAIVGHGTAWLANALPGDLFNIGGRYSVIKSVNSDTSITLTEPYLGPTSLAGGYAIQSFGGASKISDVYLAIANRLLACVDNRVYESVVGDPWNFPGTEYQQLPGGTRIIGAEASRDVAIIFTTAGVWAISGIAFDLTDADGNPQQRLEQISRDLILWSWAGIATWGNSLVVPAVDGIWLVDSVAEPQRITSGIGTRYRSYVDAGHHAGQGTVFNSHYFLPIYDVNNAFVDLLVCRLTPTRRGRGETAMGWTRFDGDGAKMIGITVRTATGVTRQPYMIGLHSVNGRICTLPYFTQSAATASDADGTAHVWELVTREYPLSIVKTFIAKLRARYELVDPAAANPTIKASYAEGEDAFVDLAPDGGEATMNDAPKFWQIGKRRRSVRIRLRSSGAIAKLVLHALELSIRQSGKT